MVIRRGGIYWVNFSPGKGSDPLGQRPGLVIQSNALNDSKINTIVMLAITSNLKFGKLPGNVLLRKGEANMPKKSVINATQIKSVDRASIQSHIGTLSSRRMEEVDAGIQLILDLD